MPYTATENVYVTSIGPDGKVVPADDPAAGFLLVPAGGEIPDELAAQYGLTSEKKAAEPEAAAPKAAAKPTEKK